MGSISYTMVENFAFVFPGQGSQFVGMGKQTREKSSAAKQLLEKADTTLGFSLSKIMFDGPEENLKQTEITQPALFVASARRTFSSLPRWAADYV